MVRERAWAVDWHGATTPTAFVLHDGHRRELGIHAIHVDEQGDAIPA